MRRLWQLAAVALLLLALPGQSSAQESCVRKIPVSVFDREGKPVLDLKPSNFRGQFRHQPVKILSTSVKSSPRVIVLFDYSGSMIQDLNTWTGEVLITEDLFEKIPADSPVTMVIFANKIFAVLETRDQALAQIRSFKSQRPKLPEGSGKTALSQTMLKVVEELKRPEPGDIICAVTDGGDNVDPVQGEVLRPLLSRGLRVFSFVPLDSFWWPSTPENAQGFAWLQDLAEATGGNTAVFEISHRKASGNNKKFQQLSPFYLLDVQLPAADNKLARWKLQVVDESGNKHPQLEVLYPRQLAPCAAGGDKTAAANSR